jgi:phage shock protein PspC (stress-responsive transcriptional regulator)
MTDEKHDELVPTPHDSAADPGSDDTTPAPETPGADQDAAAEAGDLDLHLRGEDTEPAEQADDVPLGSVDEPDDGPTPATEPETADTTPPPPAYEPPYAPVHHRLMRRPEGKLIAGVCSGLGAYTNTDPVLWRIGFVVFGLTSVGVLAYIVAWLVMPEAKPWDPIPDRPPHEAAQISRWAAIGAIILGSWVIFRGFFNIRGGWFWGLLLIGIGLAVWGRDLSGMRSPSRPSRPPPYPPVPPSPPSTTRADTWTAQQTTSSPTPPANPATPSAPSASAWPGPRTASGTPPRTDAGAPTTPLPPSRPPIDWTRQPPRPPRRRREPSYLGRLVVGACAVVIGLGLVLNNTGIIDLTAKGMLAVLVAIIGAGLVTGAWAGRARWLIFPGIALTFALMLATWAPAFVGGSYGDIVWQPQSRKALLPTYEHGAGQAVLDLTEVQFDERPREVEVDVNFGKLLVVVPEDVPVTSNAHVQGGEINNFGSNTEGWDVGNTWSEGGEKDVGLLTIDANVAFGQLEVRRERPGDDFTAGSNNDRFQFNRPRLGRR